MDHAVGFGEGADDTAGIAGRKRERRNVAGDNTSGTDHTAVADRDAGQTITFAPNQQLLPILTGFA